MNRRTRWVLALPISGAILVGYTVTISVVAERRTLEELARKAAAAEDAINRARTEETRRLIEKSMAQLAQEARDRDEAAARVEASAKTRRSETEALVQAEKRCRYLFKEQMPTSSQHMIPRLARLTRMGAGSHSDSSSAFQTASVPRRSVSSNAGWNAAVVTAA